MQSQASPSQVKAQKLQIQHDCPKLGCLPKLSGSASSGLKDFPWGLQTQSSSASGSKPWCDFSALLRTRRKSLRIGFQSQYDVPEQMLDL